MTPLWRQVTERLYAQAVAAVGPFSCTYGIDSRPGAFPKPRDFAYCADLGDRQVEIRVSPKLPSQAPSRIEGVLRHEFGHAIDLVLRDGEKVVALRSSIYRALGVRPAAGPEQTADRIAEAVFRAPIFYDHEDVQTTAQSASDGSPHAPVRPRRLGL